MLLGRSTQALAHTHNSECDLCELASAYRGPFEEKFGKLELTGINVLSFFSFLMLKVNLIIKAFHI